MIKQQGRWIARAGVLTALLVAAQLATAPLGNTLVTGSLVNLLLVVSAVCGGPGCALAVAAFSPVLARLLGIGPLWVLIPFILLGNLTLVGIWGLLGCAGARGRRLPRRLAALLAASLCKPAVLYLGVVRIALPLLALPDPQAAAVAAAFSLPQVVTALVGGGLALAVLPALERSMRAC